MSKIKVVFLIFALVVLWEQVSYGVEPASKPVVYVFPVDSEKPRFKPVERVLTGIFIGEKQKEETNAKKLAAEKIKHIKKKPKSPKTLNERTIAWITPMGAYYHEPHNDCIWVKERLWVEDKKGLLGLEPCQECFKKKNLIPDFVKKECGSREIAAAQDLLINPKFVEWVKNRLPIKDINFISSSKVLVCPRLDMTKKGMHQLALETENAYLSQTWRVIEVQVMNEGNSGDYVSSFSEENDLVNDRILEDEIKLTNTVKGNVDLKPSVGAFIKPDGSGSGK